MKKHITKRLILLSAVLVAFGSGHVLADHHGEGGKGKGKMFEKHDVDGDGTISKDEFLKHAEERFNKIDADGSGSVSKDEAKAKHEEMRKKMKDRRMDRKKAAE